MSEREVGAEVSFKRRVVREESWEMKQRPTPPVPAKPRASVLVCYSHWRAHHTPIMATKTCLGAGIVEMWRGVGLKSLSTIEFQRYSLKIDFQWP